MDNFFGDSDAFVERMRIVVDMFESRAEAARQCGVTDATIKRWITGQADPSRTNLVRLAQAAGVSIAWLATGEGSPDNAAVQAPPPKAAPLPAPVLDTLGNPVDLQQFVFIPQYRVFASAGHGHTVEDDFPQDPVAFPRAWLKRHVLTDLNNLSVISVKGDSMEGILNDRDTILVNHTLDTPADGIYVIRIGDELLVKRTQLLPNSRLRVLPANDAYEPFELDFSGNPDFAVIGRVEAFFRKI